MAFNFADLFEHTADVVPDRLALIDALRDGGDSHLTFAELEDRANRVGHVLADRNIGRGDHVGIYAQNSSEWVQAMLGCFKVGAVPVNINYRYVEDELAYLVDNADLVAVILDRRYAPRLAAVQTKAPKLRTVIHLDDRPEDGPLDREGTDEEAVTTALRALGSEAWSDVVPAASPERDFPARNGDELYIIYTGGTTGMPKGVMWRHEDVYFALGGGIDALSKERQTEFSRAEQARDSGFVMKFMVIPPLMHGAAQFGTFQQMLPGHTIVLLRKFSAESVWDAVAAEGVNTIVITGDAMGRPLIEVLDAEPDRWDLSSMFAIGSSAALFSQTVKDRFLDRFPNMMITDSIGSTEGGYNGLSIAEKGKPVSSGGPTVGAGLDVAILDDEGNLIPEGDDRIGRLARTGNIPLGYYKDEAKTAATFITAADGKRYAVAGDMAQWAGDGRITLLGRGTVSINSGGEKIFPEEVEQALKGHPAVFDCLVVGVPDERWGQRVAAVVHFRDGGAPSLEELADYARKHVAGYKVPRELHRVDGIVRSPSGKPDYPWAKRLAEAGDHLVG